MWGRSAERYFYCLMIWTEVELNDVLTDAFQLWPDNISIKFRSRIGDYFNHKTLKKLSTANWPSSVSVLMGFMWFFWMKIDKNLRILCSMFPFQRIAFILVILFEIDCFSTKVLSRVFNGSRLTGDESPKYTVFFPTLFLFYFIIILRVSLHLLPLKGHINNYPILIVRKKGKDAISEKERNKRKKEINKQ